MSDFESLLNAIPNDPNVAFILADYLEEKGDPRCELLRLMYTLKDLVEVTPERMAMEERLRELLFVENLEPVAPRYTNEFGMEFVWIPLGKFLMGSPEDEPDRNDSETQHQVTLTKGFWLGRTPVTQRQWQEVMGNNPSYFQGDENRPVEEVSWDDCQEFCEEMSQRTNLAIQLPTEAQWEYACRAGTQRARYAEDLNAISWYRENSEREPHPVGLKSANGWGLSDMLGNVGEWCDDGIRVYSKDSVIDPVGPSESSFRVIRGGSWNYHARLCRSAFRIRDVPVDSDLSLGFRCAQVPE